jgi:hypothetical protein
MKETIAATWAQEVFLVALFGPFTLLQEHVLFVPYPATKRGRPGHRPTQRIRNNVDESEAKDRETLQPVRYLRRHTKIAP